jgi:hypothetical protein
LLYWLKIIPVSLGPDGQVAFSLVSWPSLVAMTLWGLTPTIGEVFSYYLFFTETDYLQGKVTHVYITTSS